MNEETYKLHRRFDRIGRLVGDGAMSRLFNSRVTVVGLGGVGSFTGSARPQRDWSPHAGGF